MSNYEPVEDTQPRRSLLMPALFSVLAFAVGAGVGSEVTKSRIEENQVVAQAPIEPLDLDAACAPRVQESAAALHEATGKVDGLTAQIDTKLKEVSALQSEIDKASKVSADQRRRLASAKAELSDLRIQLANAETDKLNLTQNVNVLTSDLSASQIDLGEQRIATSKAQTSALDASWTAFDRGAQIEICDKGNRNVLGRCRQSVKSHVAKFEDDYKACLRVGAATPTLREASANERLPQFSQWLGQENRVTKGWYAMLCDPTLPEAGEVADGAAMVDPE